MLKPSKAKLQEALTTNSFDIGSTDRTLRMALDHSFSYLYRLQRSMVDYEEYFYTTRNVVGNPDYGDMYVDKKGRVCINFGVSLIVSQFREKFRHSKWYKQEISYDELSKNRSMFVRLPIITIDGGILRNFKVQIFDTHFVAVLPYKKDFLYEKKYNKEEGHHYYIEHTCTLQVIKNGVSFEIKTNTSMIKRNSYDGNLYNRLRMDYINNCGVEVKNKFKGSYFAVLYMNGDIGTPLQDVDIDENGDFVINYDNSAIELLNNANKPITVRFFFFRNLVKHIGYRGKLLPVREYEGAPLSEIFIIQQDEAVQYDMPIPTENLMIFRINNSDIEPNGTYRTWNLISNMNATINYANIYKVIDEIEVGDSIRVYYFYEEGYDLSYEYMYNFYFRYLYHKFGGSIESIINALYFKDIDVEKLIKITWSTTEYTGGELASLIINDGVLERTEIENLYNFIIGLSTIELNPDTRIDYDVYLLDSILEENGKSPEEATSLTEFWDVFRFIVDHPMIEYRYDDIDYMKSYQTSLTPFEYKVKKLKDFISDDINILRNYVIEERKIGMNYSFYTYEIDMDKHKVKRMITDTVDSAYGEMYMFCFDNKHKDMDLNVRVFIDGIFFDKFSEVNYKFSKYVYIPVEDIPENSFVEFEVFYSYKDTKEIKFNSIDDFAILEYSMNRIMPTLADMHIFNKHNQTIEYDKDLFQFEVVSEKYDYYINGVDGETSNVLPIEFDTNYGTYNDIEYGGTTINPENKGVTHSNTNIIRITPKSENVVGLELLIRVDKTPKFVHKRAGATDHYPFFELSDDKRNLDTEYVRLFKNGRLVSKNLYTFTEKDGKFGIHLLSRVLDVTGVTMDITPYKNRLIYYKRELESDLVDLRGFINKPFDINYFDVYLNGRKLNRNNICPISPWEIKLFGVHSSYNLEIYERDRDWEYYGVDFSNYFTLSDLIDKSFIEDDIIDKLIKDKTGDVPGNDDSEDPEPWGRTITEKTLFFEMFYYDRLLPLKLACADIMQFDAEDILSNFKDIWTKYVIITEHEAVLLVNPDNHVVGTDEGLWSVYMAGQTDRSMKRLIEKGDV